MKKIIILLVLVCLCACSNQNTTTTDTSKTDDIALNEVFNSRWSEAISKERVVILASENIGASERYLVKVLDDAALEEKAAGCAEATNLEDVKTATKTFVEEVATLFETIEFVALEETTGLSTTNTFKFELNNPEYAMDPEAISFIFYDDMHVKAKYHGVETFYTVDETTYKSLATTVANYADVIAVQGNAGCVIQYFAK